MTITVRRLTPKDWENYKTIRLEALIHEPLAFGQTYEKSVTKTDDEWKESLSRGFIVGAFIEDSLVGTVGYYFNQGKKVHHICTIFGVYVSATSRGQGVASLLLEYVLQLILDSSAVVINLSVNTDQKHAIALYEKFGFKRIGVAHKALYVNKTYYDELLMEKIIR